MIDRLPPGTSIGEMQAPLEWIYSHTTRFVGIVVITVQDGKGFILVRKGAPLAYYFRYAANVLRGPAARKYFSQQPLLDFAMQRYSHDEFQAAYAACSAEGLVSASSDEEPANAGDPECLPPEEIPVRRASPPSPPEGGAGEPRTELPGFDPARLLAEPGIIAAARFAEGLVIRSAGDADFDYLVATAEDMIRWASNLGSVADMGSFVQMTSFYREGNVLITPFGEDYLCIVARPELHFGQIRKMLRDLTALA